MPITAAQRAAAEQHQWNAAQDVHAQIRLVAGPGTGKSKTIEKRVAQVLNGGANPADVYVISFTVAASAELRQRIAAYCATQPCSAAAPLVHVSTMHSLALRILRGANLLAAMYPSDPTVLDNWERTKCLRYRVGDNYTLCSSSSLSNTYCSRCRLANATTPVHKSSSDNGCRTAGVHYLSFNPE
jgi:superfamily I DNA/RNA helicase